MHFERDVCFVSLVSFMTVMFVFTVATKFCTDWWNTGVCNMLYDFQRRNRQRSPVGISSLS